MTYVEEIRQATDYVKSKIKTDSIDLAIILGTGLGAFGNSLQGEVFPYSTIPSFPVGRVKGHENRLIYSTIADKKILVFQGRIHFYEGYPIEKVVFPIRMMKELGVSKLLITNSAGGINKEFNPGDLMIIKDHINFMGINPLVGNNPKDFGYGKKFTDMSYPYSPRLYSMLKDFSPVPLKEGIYIAVSGPSYETPAEVNFFRMIGGDAVGMSTVPEVIVANHCGIETVGISCITNPGAGITKKRLSHEEVIEVGKKVETDLVSLILNFIGLI